MAKKIIQDIVKNNNIKNTKPQSESKIKFQSPAQPISKSKSSPKNYKKIIISVLIAGSVLALGTLALINFSSATVKIYPHQEFININSPAGGFKAIRGNSDLSFEIIQLEHEESQTATASGTSNEGRKAEGEIIVYNTSSVSQKLISQTRFQEPNGKIYKIPEQIIVPANGSVETKVYAEKPGPEYNISLTDFTVPGLKGTPRFEKIYARSKTEIKGGSTDASFFITEEDIKNTQNSLEQKIKDYLWDIATKQKPNDYLLYPDALQIDFQNDSNNPENNDIVNSSDKTFSFKEKGVATGFLIKKDAFFNFLANKYLQEKDNVTVVNPESLKFNLLSRNTNDTEIKFNLEGKASFAWEINTESLLKDLVKEKDYNSVFNKYDRIEKAEIIFKPFWWHFMPKDKTRINVEVVTRNE